MRLLEHEAKSIFSKYGIPVPRGELATSPSEGRKIASELNTPVAVKAQLPVAGRGKAGGILFADSPSEAEMAVKRLVNKKIGGIEVNSVLVEEKIFIRRELYFGITVDRSKRCYVAIASSEGGMEIEEIAVAAPEKMVKVFKQYEVVMDYDAELAVMNPLIETADGMFVAADTRLIVDDNALYRHPEFKERLTEEIELSPQELEARRSGLAYVKLGGNVGVIGNGAGLVMATLDSIKLYGGEPANFLDVGGGASAEKMAAALNIVLSDPGVQVVFVNILGGITRCDVVARGILEARRRIGFRKPMVIRLMGTNEEEGRRILTEAGVHVLHSMEEAADRAVEIVKAGG